MKIKNLLYLLLIVVVLALSVVVLAKMRWEYRRDHSYWLTAEMQPKIKLPQLKGSSKQVKIRPDRDYWGVIHLPAQDSTFKLKFNYDFAVRFIKIEDIKGIHCMYGTVYLKDEVLECSDSLYYFFTHQNNEYYEMSKMSKRLYCTVKANPSKHPRIIVVSFRGRFKGAELAIIQEGKR
nr:hypothetical protein [uncultured Prevotella sp.]